MITENGSNIGHSTLFFLHHRTPTKSRNGWKWVSNSIKHNHQASNLSISPDWSKPKCTYISKCWKSSFRPHFNWCNNYKPYIWIFPWLRHDAPMFHIFLWFSYAFPMFWISSRVWAKVADSTCSSLRMASGSSTNLQLGRTKFSMEGQIFLGGWGCV